VHVENNCATGVAICRRIEIRIRVVKVTWPAFVRSDTLPNMTPEIKKSLGRVIKSRREELNWTQERLAGAADVNLRTLQRAESGIGISKENLGVIAAAFNLDEKQLLTEARHKGAASPEKRFSLRKLTSGAALIELLSETVSKQHSLEIGLPDEHEFNEFIGEDVLALAEQLENIGESKRPDLNVGKSAERTIRLCIKMGFGLFAGSYVEELKSKKGKRKNTTVLIVAVPNADPRIRRTANGLALDLVRDCRRLLHGRFAGGNTTYDWFEHELFGKSDGEERVKDTLRRLLSEIAQETETKRNGKGRPSK
jgi:transcriptional regulator with XRE-family HTH domain